MEFDKLREIIAEVLNVDADEISNEDAEKIVSVGDAVEQIKNAIN